MTQSLYHIQKEYLELAYTLEENGGEITPEIEDQLAINKDALEAKGVNYALVIRQISGEIDMLKAEVDRMNKLIKSKQAASDRLKEQIKQAMEMYEIKSIKGDLINITLRNNAASVILENEDQLPPEYVNVKEVRTPDKKAIKAAIDSGIEVPGAYLKAGRSITIK